MFSDNVDNGVGSYAYCSELYMYFCTI